MYFNQAVAGTIIIPDTAESYLLDFDVIVYDLTFDYYTPTLSESRALNIFKVKINDGDPIKLYDFPPYRFNNVEIYKIEFIRQGSIGEDITVEYQGFVRR